MAAELAEKNSEYFNKRAFSYNTDLLEGMKFVFDEVRARRSWISSKWTDTPEGQGKEIRVLDYACGTGNLSRALSPYVSKIIGIDISDNMVTEFNKEAIKAGLSSNKAFAVRGDFLAEDADEKFSHPDYFDFDLVIVGLAFHHFRDANDATRRLASRLKDGGVLFIIDGVPGQFGDHHQKVHKHGFSENEVHDAFTNGGVGENFKFSVADKPICFSIQGKRFEKTIFFARGERNKL